MSTDKSQTGRQCLRGNSDCLYCTADPKHRGEHTHRVSLGAQDKNKALRDQQVPKLPRKTQSLW